MGILTGDRAGCQNTICTAGDLSIRSVCGRRELLKYFFISACRLDGNKSECMARFSQLVDLFLYIEHVLYKVAENLGSHLPKMFEK